jgi:hypothetical protein
LLTFSETSDHLSAFITNESRLELNLLLSTIDINNGDSTLIATFADGRVRHSEDIIDLIGYHARLGSLTTFEPRISLVKHHGDVVIDDTGDVVTGGSHRDDGTSPRKIRNSIKRDGHFLIRCDLRGIRLLEGNDYLKCIDIIQNQELGTTRTLRSGGRITQGGAAARGDTVKSGDRGSDTRCKRTGSRASLDVLTNDAIDDRDGSPNRCPEHSVLDISLRLSNLRLRGGDQGDLLVNVERPVGCRSLKVVLGGDHILAGTLDTHQPLGAVHILLLLSGVERGLVRQHRLPGVDDIGLILRDAVTRRVSGGATGRSRTRGARAYRAYPCGVIQTRLGWPYPNRGTRAASTVTRRALGEGNTTGVGTGNLVSTQLLLSLVQQETVKIQLLVSAVRRRSIRGQLRVDQFLLRSQGPPRLVQGLLRTLHRHTVHIFTEQRLLRIQLRLQPIQRGPELEIIEPGQYLARLHPIPNLDHQLPELTTLGETQILLPDGRQGPRGCHLGHYHATFYLPSRRWCRLAATTSRRTKCGGQPERYQDRGT